MKILAVEHEVENASPQGFAPHLKAEAAHLWQLQQAGLLREIYFNAQKHTAILMLECASQTDAQTVLAQLPLVKAGLIEFELIELAPYDGFARLFDPTELD
jgi:muconolactone delta-isomerase